MLTSRRRVVAALVAAAVLLVPVAGCGAGEEKPKAIDPAAFVKKMTDAMVAKKSARIELELGSTLSATGDVDYAAASSSMSMKMTMGTQKINLVLADGVMYLQQTTGSKYLKIDQSDPALGSLLKQVSGIGPKSTFERIKPGLKKIVSRGTEKIDGVRLSHYVFTIDTSKVSSVLGITAAQTKLPKTITYDVYLDEDALLRRLSFKISGQALVMKASNWGEPVTIKVPPPSQVMTR